MLVGCAGRPRGNIKVDIEQVDLNPDTPGFSGEAAFELAAPRGHIGVLQLLSGPKPFLTLQ